MMQEYSLRQEGKELDVISVGNINVDFALYVDQAPEADSEVEASSFNIFHGGSAANFAVAASRLGLKAGIIGWVGSDAFGDLALQDLMREGVDVSRVRYSENLPTGSVTVIVDKAGSRRMIAFRGANKLLSQADLDDEYLSKTSVLHVSNVPAELALKAAEKAKKLSLKFSYDPGGLGAKADRAILDRALINTDLLFCNKVEAQAITSLDDVEQCVSKLASSAKVAVIKMGADGALIKAGKRLFRSPAFEVEVADTTGAGDAFNAGFVAGLLKGYSIELAGLLANAVAGLKVAKVGARQGLPTFSQVKDFLRLRGLSI